MSLGRMPVIASEIRRIRRMLTAAERRTAAAMMDGIVGAVDHDNRRGRLIIGEDEDGQPVLGPWASWLDGHNGALEIHAPLVVGQPASYASPSGTLGSGSKIQPGAYTGDQPAPSKASDAVVFAGGGVTLTLSGGKFTVDGAMETTGDVEMKAALEVRGRVTNDGVGIGRHHRHDGVEPGGGVTGHPVGEADTGDA